MTTQCGMLLRKAVSYGAIVFSLVLIAMTLRSASLIWIHDERGMGADPWWLFKRRLVIWGAIAAIQTVVMLLGFVSFRRMRDSGVRGILFAAIWLSILDLFIEPIGIWTMPWRVLGPLATLGAVLLFPVFAWLVLLVLPTNASQRGGDGQEAAPTVR